MPWALLALLVLLFVSNVFSGTSDYKTKDLNFIQHQIDAKPAVVQSATIKDSKQVIQITLKDGSKYQALLRHPAGPAARH